jgi:hypothetical protein
VTYLYSADKHCIFRQTSRAGCAVACPQRRTADRVCSFSAGQRAARTARNPATGQVHGRQGVMTKMGIAPATTSDHMREWSVSSNRREARRLATSML